MVLLMIRRQLMRESKVTFKHHGTKLTLDSAISAGGRCGQGCPSSSTTPAVIYFPSGTYMISSPINPAYLTQLIGNPNGVPTIKALASFPNSHGFALIDADPYYTQDLNCKCHMT
jgi:glucan 1,3-beta-glucosidase